MGDNFNKLTISELALLECLRELSNVNITQDDSPSIQKLRKHSSMTIKQTNKNLKRRIIPAESLP